MRPDDKMIINGHKVEEYYWAGRKVVYINNRLTEKTFDEACGYLRKGYSLKILNAGKKIE